MLEDSNIENREDFDKRLLDCHVNRFVSEIVGDVVDRVKTPTPTPPDYGLYKERLREFEEKNIKYNLWYTDEVNNWMTDLHNEVCILLEMEESEWDFSIDTINDNIANIENDFDKERMDRRFVEYFNLAKKRPIDRTALYSSIQEMWTNILDNLPETYNNIRREMEIPEVLFKDPDAPPPVEEIIDPKAKGAVKKEATKALPLKKFKSPEEEAEYMESFKVKCSKKIAEQVYEQFLFDDERKAYNEFFEYNCRRFAYNNDFFDKLKRIKGLKDIETEGKRLLVKLHLKLDTEKYYAARFPLVEVIQEETDDANKNKGKDAKKDPKKVGKDDKPAEKVIPIFIIFLRCIKQKKEKLR